MELTITEFARLGGRARWKKVSKKKRSAAMRAIAKMPRKRRNPLSTASKVVSIDSEQARV